MLFRARLAGIAGLACALFFVPAARAQQVPENDLKAAYIYNFALFTEWPPAAMPAPGSSFAFCVLGNTPMNRSLRTLAAKTVHGRSIAVRPVATPEAARGCHVLVIASSDPARVDDVVRSLGDAPVLTVADANTTEPSVAAIMLERRDSRIVFSVDLSIARTAQLRISSRVLRLAARVVGG